MAVCSSPVFETCKSQFTSIADFLDIPDDESSRTLYPNRSNSVSCPIQRDDGSVVVFQVYRVQHHLTFGPTEGRTRLYASVAIGEVAPLAVWMSWKYALAGLQYGLDILRNSGGMIKWVQVLQRLFLGPRPGDQASMRPARLRFRPSHRKGNAAKTSTRLVAMAIGVDRDRAAKKTRGLLP